MGEGDVENAQPGGVPDGSGGTSLVDTIGAATGATKGISIALLQIRDAVIDSSAHLLVDHLAHIEGLGRPPRSGQASIGTYGDPVGRAGSSTNSTSASTGDTRRARPAAGRVRDCQPGRNPFVDQFAQTWTVIGVLVGVVFGVGGSAWGRSRSSAAGTLAVGVLAAVVMSEAIGWQLIGDRSLATTTMALLLLIGLALPILMLPRDRRRQGVLLAAGATIPVLLVMVTVGVAG